MLRLVFTIFIFAIAFTGCNNPTEKSKNSIDTVAANRKIADSVSALHNDISVATSNDRGAELIIRNDCRNCHREREKLIGPAFADISRKYQIKDIDSLAYKVIKGGSGHWGNVAMSAHPALSVDSVKEIVRFILKIR